MYVPHSCTFLSVLCRSAEAAGAEYAVVTYSFILTVVDLYLPQKEASLMMGDSCTVTHLSMGVIVYLR